MASQRTYGAIADMLVKGDMLQFILAPQAEDGEHVALAFDLAKR